MTGHLEASWPRLYAILDVERCASRGLDPLVVADAWLGAGVRLIQLRAKALPSGEFHDLAATLTTRAQAADARVIVNDRADIARSVGAAGVHVGQDDLSPTDVRTVVGDAAVVGLSTHSVAQATAALTMPITYLAVGPVFATVTKNTGYDAVGLDLVGAAAGLAGGGVPIVGIGGITMERAPAVIEAGAASVAVISDLLADDLSARARAWLSALR